MTTIRLLLAVAAVSQLGSVDRRYAEEGGNLVIDPCIIKVQDEVRIPAQEAGVIMRMPVKEGSRIAKGDVLATIDDREAKMALRIAQNGFEAARQRVMDKIEETYARKAAEVAKVDWEKALKANRDHPDAIPDIDVRQKKLTWERSGLQIEKAQKDRQLAILDARTKKAELEAAKMGVDMRTILAPFDGEVVDTFRHEAEWVNPGDPILKLVRLDALYVEGFAYARDYDRGELIGRPVTVRVAKARGREVSVPGTIVYVSQKVTSQGEYEVRAEVQNQREGDNWLIPPGLGVKAKMTIHLGPESRVQSPEPETRRR